MSNPGFMAYPEEEKAKQVLRLAHQKGFEGSLVTLRNPDMPPIYGVKFMWPDHWTETEIKQFYEECEK